MNVLVTGFEPFGENAINPSQLLAEELGGVVLPVSYARAANELRAAVDERKPELVLCFGLAEKSTAVAVERFAHNLDEASTLDNEDAGGSGAEIEVAGPVAYRTRLPVEAIVAALEAEEIPVEISRDAGGYLCNHVFYVLMHTLGPDQLGGFVHVPPLDVLPLEQLTRAARVIVEVCERRASTS